MLERPNILLIQTAFLGDVLLTTPMIRAIKRHIPDCRLTILVKAQALPVTENNPHIDETLVFNKNTREMWGLVKTIRRKRFDILLSVHQSHRTGIVAFLSRIRLRYGYKKAGFSFFAYNKRLRRDYSKPEIRRLLEFLTHSVLPGVTNFDESLEMVETKEKALEARGLLESHGIRKPIFIAPSSVWPTKRWTPEGFAELAGILAKEYQSPVIFIGSKDDRKIADIVMKLVNIFHPTHLQDRIKNFCGETDLKLLYSLLKQGRLLVSCDSAPVHMGCAAQIPVVAIFGPTTPSLGYAPIAPKTIVAQLDDLSCRPCGTHGGKECPLLHFRCMRDLSPQTVMLSVRKVMGLT